MGRRTQRAVERDEELERVRGRIEHWRRTRPRRTAMPEALWLAAAGLVAERGLNAVAKDLRLSYATLKLRVFEAERLEQRSSREALGGFVELNGLDLLGPGNVAASVLELTDAGGARMTLRLPADHAVDVVGLVAAFVGRS